MAQGPSILQTPIVPLALVFFIMYFMVIRPEKNKAKEHKRAISNLKKNDEIVTAGGIHATVINIKDMTFVVRIDDNTRVEIDKTAVARIKKTS